MTRRRIGSADGRWSAPSRCLRRIGPVPRIAAVLCAAAQWTGCSGAGSGPPPVVPSAEPEPASESSGASPGQDDAEAGSPEPVAFQPPTEAEVALQDAAAERHAAAEMRRIECDDGDAASCAAALAALTEAADAYRALVRDYPASPYTCDNLFNLGTCLYMLDRFEESIERFRAVADAEPCADRRRDALSNQIAILGNLFQPAWIPETPPTHEERDADGTVRTVPDPAPIPGLLAEWHDAMRRWIALYPEDRANLGYRRTIAAQLYFLGHWDEARAEYWAVFALSCSDPSKQEIALESWQILETLARSAGDVGEIERLQDSVLRGVCPTPPPGGVIATNEPDLPMTEYSGAWAAMMSSGEFAQGIAAARVGERFAEASRLYLRAVETNDPNDFREAARTLLEAVAAHPDNADAPAAIRMAAVAFQRADEPVRAVESWNRLIRHCSPPTEYAEQCDRAAQAEGGSRVVLSEAYYHVARNARRIFDLEEARRNLQLLEPAAGRATRGVRMRFLHECLDDARRPCTDFEFGAEAVRALADVNRLLGRYSEAAGYVRRIIDDGYEADAARIAAMRLDIVTLYESGRAWPDMSSAADEYLRAYGGDRSRRFDVLHVRLILHRDAERQGDRRAIDRAVIALEEAYDRLSLEEKTLLGDARLSPGQMEDVLAAQDVLSRARFDAIESKFREFDRCRFAGRSLRTVAGDLVSFKDNLVRMARELTNGYADILTRYPVAPTWGVACRYRIALVWNELVERIGGLDRQLRPEWLALRISSDGTTLRDLLDETAIGLRGVEIRPGLTLAQCVRRYLVGDGSPASGGILGALAFARSMAVTGEWVRRSIELVRQLALSSDPQLLFANGPMPEVSGLVFGEGLDPIAR